METSVLPPDVAMCLSRTSRQKKRLQKEDRDKQLIQLDKQLRSLMMAKRLLPMVPLAEPYQKGWKRSFVLRADLKASKYAAFYEALLTKINTVQYCTDKAFTTKRRRKGKKVREVIPQTLKEFWLSDWGTPRAKLTDAEKTCFHIEQRWTGSGPPELCYVFNDQWRYQLKVEPNIISEVKMHDSLLEQQLAELDGYIEYNQLSNRIYRLTKGRTNYWRRYQSERPGERNHLKNKPMHTILDACKD